jgi:hypothetical protein
MLPWLEHGPYFKSGGPPALDGDRFLVAIPRGDGEYDFWLVTASGKDPRRPLRGVTAWWLQNGDSWDSWKRVSHYIPLDGQRRKVTKEVTTIE